MSEENNIEMLKEKFRILLTTFNDQFDILNPDDISRLLKINDERIIKKRHGYIMSIQAWLESKIISLNNKDKRTFELRLDRKKIREEIFNIFFPDNN